MNVCTSAGHLANFSFSFLPLFCYRILSLIAVTRRLSSSPPLSRSFTIDRHVFTNTFETFHHGFLFQLLVPCFRGSNTFLFIYWFNRSRKLSVSFHANFTSIRIVRYPSCLHPSKRRIVYHSFS